MANSVAPESAPVRVWMDGCYDLFHYGHANALRQAKIMCDYLVAGVHNDEEIRKNKGSPVMNLSERLRLVSAIKWVDEIQPDAPYLPTCEMLDRYNCSFCVHGDGEVITAANGEDAYQLLKRGGRYKEFRRTDGISTTDLIQRILLRKITPSFSASRVSDDRPPEYFENLLSSLSTGPDAKSPYTSVYRYTPDSQHFSALCHGKTPANDESVVYTAASFDMIHTGHLNFLEAILRKLSPVYLIVGLYNDSTATEVEENLPVMTLEERTLSVLPLKMVQCVIMDVPRSVTAEMVEFFRISYVCRPDMSLISVGDSSGRKPSDVLCNITSDSVAGDSSLMKFTMIDRILKQSDVYEERNRKKLARASKV